jgi:hypothetical protein
LLLHPLLPLPLPASAASDAGIRKQNTLAAKATPWPPTIESIATPTKSITQDAARNINLSAVEVHHHPKQ